MKVALKITSGKSAGKELSVNVDQFIIGREEGCHLRVASDAISRKHCRIKKENGAVTVRDLGSRNGTIVNGQKITDKIELKPGDKMSVGPLQFEVLIEYGLGGPKQPKVQDVKDVVARTAQKPVDPEAEFASWLNEDDDDVTASTETQRFSVDDIKVVKSQAEVEAEAKKAAEKAKKEKEKQKYGKLPQQTQTAAPKDTKEAANEMLKKLFKK
jgi:pSer/pThr/pTyr-binding forkhead associated (FHA) protein